MRNDMDSLLNSLFSGGRLQVGGGTRSRAAQEAEEFLKQVEAAGKGVRGGLDRQISDLERINDEAQRSMAEMRRLLESDGAAAPPESAPEKPAEAQKAEARPTAKGAAEEPPRDTAALFLSLIHI